MLCTIILITVFIITLLHASPNLSYPILPLWRSLLLLDGFNKQCFEPLHTIREPHSRQSVHVHNLLHCVRRTRLTLQQELGRTPSDEEMAAQSQMSPQKYIKMLRLTKHATS